MNFQRQHLKGLDDLKSTIEKYDRNVRLKNKVEIELRDRT